MTILARRFTIVCLFISLFAMGLAIVVQQAERRRQPGVIGLMAPCPQPAGIHCRAAL